MKNYLLLRKKKTRISRTTLPQQIIKTLFLELNYNNLVFHEFLKK